MKKRILVALAALSLLSSNLPLFAADKGDVSAQLKELITQIQTKLQDGKPTESALAEDLKKFDALFEEHKGEKTDDVANILFMKAMLYIQVLDQSDKGLALIEQIKRDFPDTKQGKNADQVIDGMKKQQEAKKVREALVVGSKFPDFDEKDVTGKPMSIANYKGKVVLVDFWATWCGPCVKELPHVLKTYEKHHGEGFEIVGISLDQDKKKLTNFTEEKKMTWQQFFDGKGWGNKLAAKYGVQSIPATYLLDDTGTILGTDLRDEALEEAVTKALAKK